MGRRFLLYFALTGLLIAALVGVDVLVLAVNNPNTRLHHYYMALGNSLSFGYQPDLNFTSGFADDLYASLQKENVSGIINYACGGESSTTMIQGSCPGRLKHESYTGPQLNAALSFLTQHRGQVSPVTLEIGANDVLQDWNPTTCTAASTAATDLDKLDQNLTKIILPSLLDALATTSGSRAGNLVLLNYYNPYARQCTNSPDFIHLLNDHLAADAAQFQVPVVDVYSAFGGDTATADHICTYTWICSSFRDFHPTNQGYQVIADAVEQTLGYPNPIKNPLPGISVGGM
jgi:lysophospholipase L1-like esterase